MSGQEGRERNRSQQDQHVVGTGPIQIVTERCVHPGECRVEPATRLPQSRYANEPHVAVGLDHAVGHHAGQKETGDGEMHGNGSDNEQDEWRDDPAIVRFQRV